VNMVFMVKVFEGCGMCLAAAGQKEAKEGLDGEIYVSILEIQALETAQQQRQSLHGSEAVQVAVEDCHGRSQIYTPPIARTSPGAHGGITALLCLSLPPWRLGNHGLGSRLAARPGGTPARSAAPASTRSETVGATVSFAARPFPSTPAGRGANRTEHTHNQCSTAGRRPPAKRLPLSDLQAAA